MCSGSLEDASLRSRAVSDAPEGLVNSDTAMLRSEVSLTCSYLSDQVWWGHFDDYIILVERYNKSQKAKKEEGFLKELLLKANEM